MIGLSSLEYECTAEKTEDQGLRFADCDLHNQGLRFAIGAFCINRKPAVTAITAVRISSRPEHLMRTTLTNTEEYDNYAVRPKLTKPYPIRTLDACT
jgi:hypothetical protein